jgi:hypothetical protein
VTGLEGRYKIDLRMSTSLLADGQDPADPSLEAGLARLGLLVRGERYRSHLYAAALVRQPPCASSGFSTKRHHP